MNAPIIRTKDLPRRTIRALWDCLEEHEALLQCEYVETTPAWLRSAFADREKQKKQWVDIVESDREIRSMKLYIGIKSIKEESARLLKYLRKIESI